MADDQKRSHTLADHLLGQDVAHEHDGDADHDHDHYEFDADEPLEDNPLWIQDNITLLTVGIDIGSAGTQVIFSRMHCAGSGEDLHQPLFRRQPRDAVSSRRSRSRPM